MDRLRQLRAALTRDSRFLDRDEFPWSGALVNNLSWLIVYPALCLLLGLITAVLATGVSYERAFKAIIFVPMAISAVAVGVIWLLVFSPDPDIGVVNAVIEGAGGDPGVMARTRRTSSTTRSSSRTSGPPPASS